MAKKETTKASKTAKTSSKTKAVVKTKPASKTTKYNPLKGKRESVLKALKALKALNSGSAVTADKVATKSGLTVNDIKHYCYKETDLCMNGYIGRCVQEGSRNLTYHLTAKGAKLLK